MCLCLKHPGRLRCNWPGLHHQNARRRPGSHQQNRNYLSHFISLPRKANKLSVSLDFLLGFRVYFCAILPRPVTLPRFSEALPSRAGGGGNPTRAGGPGPPQAVTCARRTRLQGIRAFPNPPAPGPSARAGPISPCPVSDSMPGLPVPSTAATRAVSPAPLTGAYLGYTRSLSIFVAS